MNPLEDRVQVVTSSLSADELPTGCILANSKVRVQRANENH